MSEDAIEYDVAFSFLAGDEPLAVAFSEGLADRYRSFVYSKRQEQLAGTDGQETFGRVFGKTATTVVVLYRDGWGSTPWTHVEETTIHNRTLVDGWDFLLFIKLDPLATMPKWLPNTRIWQDFSRYGRSGTLPVITHHIQRGGGSPRVESIEAQATRVKNAAAFAMERKAFLNSERGVLAAQTSVIEIIRLIEVKCAELSPVIALQTKRSPAPYELAVLGSAAGMIRWYSRYVNTLENTYLELSYWRGHPPIMGVHYFTGDEPPKLESTCYEFDIAAPDDYFWRPQARDDLKSLSNEAIVDAFIRGLLQQINASL